VFSISSGVDFCICRVRGVVVYIRLSTVLDVITAIFLLLTIGVIGYVLLLLANRQSTLNPFPPPTNVSYLVIATDLPTVTPSNTPTATATPLPTFTPTASPTRTATATPLPTFTPVLAVPTQPTKAGVTPVTPTVVLAIAYTAKPVAYQTNQTADGCKWSSIAGTVLDKAGKPIAGVAVRVVGGSGTINETHYSGQEPRFGAGGFEAFLGTLPREDDYTVQLLGTTGTPLSTAVAVRTKTGCQQNVAFLTFQQTP
jgi:hypothetical protein